MFDDTMKLQDCALLTAVFHLHEDCQDQALNSPTARRDGSSVQELFIDASSWVCQVKLEKLLTDTGY